MASYLQASTKSTGDGKLYFIDPGTFHFCSYWWFLFIYFSFFFKLKFYVFLYYIFGGFELWSATFFVCFLTLTLLCFVDAIWSCWGNHIRLGIWHFVWVLFPPSFFVIGCLLSAWIFLDRQRKFIKKAPNKRRVHNPCTCQKVGKTTPARPKTLRSPHMVYEIKQG